MNLTYKILWIDDAEDWIESIDRDILDDYIKAEGFDPEFEIRSSPEDIALDVDGKSFDLMVIDYNITENGHKCGDDIIKSVRDNDCLTEVIFYSQNSSTILRKKAAEKEIDGVFYANRDQDSLLRKIQDVFDLTVRKVVDVNNMRGIVMAGVADLDHLLGDLIREIHTKLDEDGRVSHRKKLLERMLPAAKSLRRLMADEDHASLQELQKAINVLKDLEPKSFDELVKYRGFDSYKRVEIATGLCKIYVHLEPHRVQIEEIKTVLKWRNALAHQRPSIENGVYVFEPDEGVPQNFDAAMTRELRKKIREHRAFLESIMEAVRNS